jgi:superfamily II DNA or RNA helicase
MILDNENKNLKVYQWIEYNTNLGNFDIVTGYFTIGALAFLSEKTNEKIDKYRFIIGDIVSTPDQKVKSIDLLNENLSGEDAFKLSLWAKQASQFLKQNKVECKTLEPNFCHAKLYLSKSKINNPVQEIYIMGSSNLTEAGIGLKSNQNIELNSAGTGTESIYAELKTWFEDLWNKPQAHSIKTIKDDNNKEKKVDFKQYLIDEISKIFKVYEPLDIYHKILFELFNEEQDPDFQRDLGRLETSQIHKHLYPFQKNGVENLLKTLNKYNGAILADAVGLGKTWTTLAVIKYYQTKGRDTLLICPKKLEDNWKQYIKRQNSIFEDDAFDYDMNFHTDFTERNLEGNKINFEHFTNDKPKLIVIDESHNLRNDKSIKYKILMEHILQKARGDVKVLLLSATPINNNFKDVRNQFALMTKGDNTGFRELLDVRSLTKTFSDVQANFNKWDTQKGQNLNQFYQEIHQSDFFKLTEHLVVARTRKNIKTHFDSSFHFPKVEAPINIFKTPLQFGDFENLPDLMEKLQLNLSAYQPSQFTLTLAEIEAKEAEKANNKKKAKDEVLTDSLQREYFLVKMMKILMLKRLESSWIAFKITIDNIYRHHDNALKKIKEYQTTKKEVIIEVESDEDIETDEDLDLKLESFTLGKKNPIKLSAIDNAGRLNDFKDAIVKDKENLLIIKHNINDFEKAFNTDPKSDIKINELHTVISQKQKSKNKKIVIFTAYKDTAEYLYKQINSKHKNAPIGLVYSDVAIHSNIDSPIKIQKLLQHFAPYTKLYLEKKWEGFAMEKTKENYPEWQKWLVDSQPSYSAVVEKPIDILITTDVLSEGQNLQDADMVINYDIHWNPVRVIQRFGRIDRIGSPNDTIKCINFWPSEDIEGYINLKSRVEKRMAVMQFIGSEVMKDFTKEFAEIAQNPIEDKQNEDLLKQMKTKLEDFETDQSLGFDDFSFDVFRQQLFEVLNQRRKELENLPNGIFSGFEIEKKPNHKKGLIALLGVLPKKEGKHSSFELIYLDEKGETISDNQKVILELLSEYRNASRKVDAEIDNGNNIELEKLQTHLLKWIEKQHITVVSDDQGNDKNGAGQNSLDILGALQGGKKSTITELKNNETVFTKKYDLITWLILS